MIGVKKVGVENLRGLLNTGLIELKPLTLLVGKNSAGKSTFARMFPLFRQSTEANRNAPFLWWGQYVDYGSFSQAVNRTSEDKKIVFSFQIELSPFFSFRTPKVQTLLADPVPMTVTLTVRGYDDRSYVSEVLISMHDLTATIEMHPNSGVVKITGGYSSSWIPDAKMGSYVRPGKYLPDIFYIIIQNKEVEGKIRPIQTVAEGSPFDRALQLAIGNRLHGNTSLTTIKEITDNLVSSSQENCLEILKRGVGQRGAARQFITAVRADPKYFNRIRELKFLSQIHSIMADLNYEIDQFANSVRYIGPIRATAQRFYRPQELSVADMDPRGENLAVLLNDLQNQWYFGVFNKWLEKYLGFEVRAAKEGSQIELKIRFSDNEHATNLADMGFGLSQVLPIATQLWMAANAGRLTRQSAKKHSYVVIEQPELHLHPAFQTRLADLFVGAINDRPSTPAAGDVSIIAETHSSTLVNRIGEMISEGKIKAEDVQIILFEQASPTGCVELKFAHFDSEGILQNWPFGFFSAGAYE